MARKPTRFVAPLKDEEKELLEHLRDHGETPRIRRRAHAILLSAAGRSIDEICDIFETSRVTVTSWLNRWRSDGPAGLGDAPRPGGPPKLTDEEREVVLKLIKGFPNSPKSVLKKIKEKTGKTIGARTLRRIARAGKLRWKRMRRSLKDRRDDDEFREAQQHIDKFIEHHKAGDYDLYYFDEAGFSLTPCVPYAWQPEGERLEIPSRKSGQINALGLLSYDGQLIPYVTEGTVNTDVVVACIDDFSMKLNGRDTLVIIDNASPHTSAHFLSYLETWESRGLHFYFLPPYCPELNLIEILWRMMKYHWLRPTYYVSFKALREAVNHILANVGPKFRLSFT